MLPVCDTGAIELFSRKPLTQTVYMVGMLIGSFLFGWMSDKVGQKGCSTIDNFFFTDWTKGNNDDLVDNPRRWRVFPILSSTNSRPLLCPSHL